MAHDLIWVENRRTPKVKTRGEKYEPTEAEGKIVKRRAATAEEEKTIARGDWVRVNKHGDKPGDPGYKRKKSGVRPGRHTNSLTAAVETGITHAGLAVVSVDGLSVLLAQRRMDETDDANVQESWEFPGGGLDEGETPLEGAQREFGEEIGFPLPPGVLMNWWINDIYQGFVYRLRDELDLTDWAPTEEVQAVGWYTQDEASSLNLRPEVRDTTPWYMLFTENSTVSGNEDTMDDTEPTYSAADFGLDGPIPVHGVVAPEDAPSGDGRGFTGGAMTKRPLRIPFSDQHVSVGNHDGSVVVGSVDRMMRKDGLIHWEGSLMESPDAENLVARMQHFGGRYGVSVDGDQGSIDAARQDGVLWFDQVRAAGLTAVAIPAFHEAYVQFGHHPEMPASDESGEALAASAYESGDMVGASTFARGPGWVTDPKATNRIHDYWTKKGEPGYAKVGWGTPGDFTRAKKLIGAKIAEHSPDKLRFLNQIIAQWHHDALGYWPGELGKPGNAPDTKENRQRAARHAVGAETQAFDVDYSEVTRLLTEHSPEGIQPLEAMDENGDSVWETVLVSSAGVAVKPPLSYFHRYDDGSALTIEEPDANGIRRVHGYAAQWGVCHVGMSGRCVEPPRTYSDDYPDFHLGRTLTDEGYVYTGVLTYGVGHRDAETILSESPDQAYFDNVNNAWAAVRIGEDETGVWFSGYVLPGVDPDHLVKIEASGQVSGEWLAGELRACLTVNVPGFPVRHSSVEYDEAGNVLALAAAAFQTNWALNGAENSECVQASLTERMDALRRIDAESRFAALKSQWEN